MNDKSNIAKIARIVGSSESEVLAGLAFPQADLSSISSVSDARLAYMASADLTSFMDVALSKWLSLSFNQSQALEVFRKTIPGSTSNLAAVIRLLELANSLDDISSVARLIPRGSHGWPSLVKRARRFF